MLLVIYSRNFTALFQLNAASFVQLGPNFFYIYGSLLSFMLYSDIKDLKSALVSMKTEYFR